MPGVAQRINAAMRRGGLMALGAVCAVVAGIFLTVAGWIAAVDAFGPLVAALLVAGGYLILALLLFLMARRPPPRPPSSGRTPPPPPPLSEAFFAGLRAGRRMRRK